jgi:glycine cleavage system transcriptional repressor
MKPVNELAITVIGFDRPGIIADVTEILAGLGLNLTDSTMTLLRGHFAMTLICAGPPPAEEVQAALAAMTADGSLVATVRDIAPEPEHTADGSHHLLTLHGADRLGIVATVSRALAEFGCNITDLTTRLADDLYVAIAEVDVPGVVDLDHLHDRLAAVGRALGVEIALRPAEADVL